MIAKGKILMVVMAVVLAAAAQAWSQSDDRIIAVVNDELITLNDLQHYVTSAYVSMAKRGANPQQLQKIKADLETNGLDRLIDDKLVLSKANELKLKISERDVQQRIDSVKEQYPSEQAFIDALTQSGTTLADLKKKIAEQVKIKTFLDAYIPPRVKVSPNEVIRYYKDHLNEYWQKDRVDLNSIFIGFGADKTLARQRFDKAVKEIGDGADFLETAKKYSDSPPIGVVKKGDLVPQIENVVFNLNEGQVSPMIETDSGYYLFQVKKKMPMEVLAFRDVKDKLRDVIYQQKFKNEYDKFLNELRKDAFIEIKK